MIQGILTWVNPTANTDGTPYNAASENAGYELAFDSDVPAVTLPFALGTTFDMSTTTAFQDLTSGTHDVRLRVVTKGGTKSAYAVGTFQIVGTPLAPSALDVD